MKKRLLLCLVLLSIAGCVRSTDPETGAEQTYIDPNAAVKVEENVEDVIEIGTALSAIFPVLIPIVTAASGGLLAWRKIKPKLTEAQNEATMYHTATEAAINVAEYLKEANPKTWERIKKKVHMTTETENVIRALRGKPPIV